MKTGKLFRRFCIGILLLFCGCIPCWWYWRFRHSVFAQDDPGLINFLSDDNISLAQKTVSNISSNRWRPVANVGFVLVHQLVNNSYFGWWTVNVILLGLLVVVCTGLFVRASDSIPVGMALGLLVATSRFSQYQVINATGVMEVLGNIFFIMMLFGVYEYWRSHDIRWIHISLIFFSILTFTHERYQTILVAWLIFFAFHSGWKYIAKFTWCVAYALPVILLNFFKKYIFHIPLLVGTESLSSMGYTAQSTVSHLFMALSGLCGLNLGPNHLVGSSFEVLNINHQMASVGIVFLLEHFYLVPYFVTKISPRQLSFGT